MMKLGTYVEILNYVADTAAAGAYYQKLGLAALGDDVYTDGRYHLHLLPGSGANPSLRYYGCDLPALQASGLDIVDDTLKSPAGIRILLSSDPPPRELPHDNVASGGGHHAPGKVRRAVRLHSRPRSGMRLLGGGWL